MYCICLHYCRLSLMAKHVRIDSIFKRRINDSLGENETSSYAQNAEISELENRPQNKAPEQDGWWVSRSWYAYLYWKRNSKKNLARTLL